MAAKFDAAAAVAQGFTGGDGIPVHLTMPVDRPWVPLHILATGKAPDEVVQADVFLLTDEKPRLLAGPGLSLDRSEPASTSLLDDLRSDQGMGWVPARSHLTYLQVDVPRATSTTTSRRRPTRRRCPPSGTPASPAPADTAVPGGTDGSTIWPVVAAVAAVLVLRRRARSPGLRRRQAGLSGGSGARGRA